MIILTAGNSLTQLPDASFCIISNRRMCLQSHRDNHQPNHCDNYQCDHSQPTITLTIERTINSTIETTVNTTTHDHRDNHQCSHLDNHHCNYSKTSKITTNLTTTATSCKFLSCCYQPILNNASSYCHQFQFLVLTATNLSFL